MVRHFAAAGGTEGDRASVPFLHYPLGQCSAAPFKFLQPSLQVSDAMIGGGMVNGPL